jgi:hypothetical protein
MTISRSDGVVNIVVLPLAAVVMMALLFFDFFDRAARTVLTGRALVLLSHRRAHVAPFHDLVERGGLRSTFRRNLFRQDDGFQKPSE